MVYPASVPQAAVTGSLVQRLRSTVLPQATGGTGDRVLVGGETAAGIDASSYLGHRLPLVIDTWIPLMMFTITFGLSMDRDRGAQRHHGRPPQHLSAHPAAQLQLQC